MVWLATSPLPRSADFPVPQSEIHGPAGLRDASVVPLFPAAHSMLCPRTKHEVKVLDSIHLVKGRGRILSLLESGHPIEAEDHIRRRRSSCKREGPLFKVQEPNDGVGNDRCGNLRMWTYGGNAIWVSRPDVSTKYCSGERACNYDRSARNCSGRGGHSAGSGIRYIQPYLQGYRNL